MSRAGPTPASHTRIIEFRAVTCRIRTHERGAKVYLWELLPQPDAKVEAASVINR